MLRLSVLLENISSHCSRTEPGSDSPRSLVPDGPYNRLLNCAKSLGLGLKLEVSVDLPRSSLAAFLPSLLQ